VRRRRICGPGPLRVRCVLRASFPFSIKYIYLLFVRAVQRTFEVRFGCNARASFSTRPNERKAKRRNVMRLLVEDHRMVLLMIATSTTSLEHIPCRAPVDSTSDSVCVSSRARNPASIGPTSLIYDTHYCICQNCWTISVLFSLTFAIISAPDPASRRPRISHDGVVLELDDNAISQVF
jgi:hypothetical protein